MSAKAGMLLKSEMTAAAGKTASSWMSSAVGPKEQKLEKTANNNIQQGNQQQYCSWNSQLEH
jgi:hypothetical protein